MFESIASEHADVAIPALLRHTFRVVEIDPSMCCLVVSRPQSAACSTADTDAAEVTRAATVLTAPGH